jgi:hypothetical protein
MRCSNQACLSSEAPHGNAVLLSRSSARRPAHFAFRYLSKNFTAIAADSLHHGSLIQNG